MKKRRISDTHAEMRRFRPQDTKKGGCPEGHPPLNTSEKDYMVLPEAARCILISTFSVRLE